MGITAIDLDDGNMDDINNEHQPEDDDQIEPAEAGESVEESATSWTVDADATVEEPTVDADATIEDFAVGDEIIDDEEPPHDNTVPPAPLAGVAVAQYDRLTRDPYATFGGVLSGIAHRYGWDVALTRLAFVVLLIISAGTALFAYFLAWLIIPRATHWPPARVQGGRSRLSGRDLGIGLIGLGAIVVLGIGSGDAASVLVPLAMVGGGIWLLLQNPRDNEDVRPAPSVVSHVVPTQPPIAPTPVPKRSRLRRFGLIGIFGFLALALLAVIAIPLILIAVVTGGDFEIDGDAEYVFRPASIAEIQNVIVEDAGEIILDLRDVDFDSIGRSDDPIRIDVDLDVGRIEVRLPEDVRVSVDAESDIGDVTVFGSNDDGIKPSRSIVEDDPQLDLELDLNLGEIVVTRSNVTSSTTFVEVN